MKTPMNKPKRRYDVVYRLVKVYGQTKTSKMLGIAQSTVSAHIRGVHRMRKSRVLLAKKHLRFLRTKA